MLECHIVAILLFLAAVLEYTGRTLRLMNLWPKLALGGLWGGCNLPRSGAKVRAPA